MSKPDDNNPFRSGNTSALDLDQLDKEGADNWNPWNKQRNQERSPWASDDWGGGKTDWPEEFGGGGGGGGNGGTAALDISDFDAEAFEKQKTPRANKGGNDWGDIEDFFGGGGNGGTAALDLSGFQSDQEGEDLEDEVFQRRRAERTEDARDPHTHNDQRGRLTYEGGQGDPHKEERHASRGSGRNRVNDSFSKEALEDKKMEALADDGPLMPHERTMAIGLDEIRNQAPPPREGSGLRKAASSAPEDEALFRTEALDIEEIRKGISRSGPMPEPADLFPEESTVAINIPELNQTPPTTDFPAPSVANPKAFKTSMLDKAELEKHRLNEVASGAKLMIFVPGNQPVPFDLRPGITNVGRERTNHLVLADPYCSRKHLRVKKYQGHFEARDIGSDNGTLLNGAAMHHNKDMPLSHGDELRIGSTTMRFILGQPGPEDYSPPRFERSITASKPAIPRYTDRERAVNGPATSRVQAPRQAEAAKKGGMSTATIVVVVALLLGILVLVAAAVIFLVFAGSKEATSALPALQQITKQV